MTLIVSCTRCGKELRSQDQYAGKRVRCSQCGTVNQLPTQAAAMPEPLVESAFCFICGKDFSVDRDLVRDTKKRTYHRRCYEDASRYQRSRRQDDSRRRSPQTPGGSRPASPTHRTPAPAAHRTPAAPAQVPAEPDDELVELTELPGPSNDLWADLSGPATPLLDAPSFQGSLASAPGAFSGRRDSVWLYVLIGFGAAVPVVVLLFIAIQLLISSFTGPDQSVATTDPAVAATGDQLPEGTTAPRASPDLPQSSGGAENPFLTPEETHSSTSSTPPSPETSSSASLPEPESETSEQSALPAAASPGQSLTAYGAGALLGFACVAVIGIPIGAVLLRMACTFVGETPPVFGAALGIAFAMLMAKVLVGFVLNFVLGQGAAGIASLAAGLMTDGAIISGALSTSFGKGIGIALIVLVISIGLMFLLGVIAFVLVLVLAGARGR